MSRHKHDGTITNSIVYPMTRALYGRDLRQPIGGDFGFSGRLASHYLAQAGLGLERRALRHRHLDDDDRDRGRLQVCQSFLGAKIHDPKDPGTSLAEMLQQVVSSVFELMATYRDRIAAVGQPEAVPLFGFVHEVGLEPIPVNVEGMLAIYRQAARDLPELWERILRPATLSEIVAHAARPNGSFHLDDELWVRVVYDFAVAHQRRVLRPEQVLGALVPLYLGRTASFVLETEKSRPAEVETAIRGARTGVPAAEGPADRAPRRAGGVRCGAS